MTAKALDYGAEHQDWAARWTHLGKTSFLKQSQIHSPEKWEAFYDRISDVWEQMAGISLAGAREIAAVLACHGHIRRGESILDIGCGPGNLSMALAGQGCRITAVDNSPGMIRVLEDKIRVKGDSRVQPLALDWNRLESKQNHDLAMAAFFPEAFSPEGILHMEQLARKRCILVLGNGKPAFPFYGQIWTRIMDRPLPAPAEHLTCAQNFLKQTHRSPEVYPLSLPAVLDIERHRARDYFRSYFAMFDCSGPRTDKIIDQVLAPHTRHDRILFKGESGAALVCWPVSVNQERR